MDVTLKTNEGSIKTVPLSIAKTWRYYRDIVSDGLVKEGEVVPLPLTDKQLDLWLRLAVAMNEATIESATNEIFSDFSLPRRSALMPIVRLLDPDEDTWMLYSELDVFEEEHITSDDPLVIKKRVYEALGRQVRYGTFNEAHPCVNSLILKQDYPHCVSERDELQKAYARLFGQCPDPCQEDMDKVRLGHFAHRNLTKANIVAGVVYSDWIRAGRPGELHWRMVSWSSIIELGVAEATYRMFSVDGYEVPIALQAVEKATNPGQPALLLTVMAHDGVAQPGVDGYNCILRGRRQLIVMEAEYQRRLGLWYEHYFALLEKGEKTQLSIDTVAQLSGAHQILMKKSGGLPASSLEIRLNQPTPHTKKVLLFYADYCRRMAEAFIYDPSL